VVITSFTSQSAFKKAGIKAQKAPPKRAAHIIINNVENLGKSGEPKIAKYELKTAPIIYCP